GMGDTAPDLRGDLYSLGCTFYHLLTGRVPFPGGNWTSKLLRHRLEAPAPVRSLRPEVPPEAAAVVERLMAREPERRYPAAPAPRRRPRPPRPPPGPGRVARAPPRRPGRARRRGGRRGGGALGGASAGRPAAAAGQRGGARPRPRRGPGPGHQGGRGAAPL